MCLFFKRFSKMDFVGKAKRIFGSVISMCIITISAMVAILFNMYTAKQHVNFGMNEKIFVAAHVIIVLILMYLGNWITKEKSRNWKQESSFWIIVICVVVFLCVARIDPEWIFMEHLLTTVVSIVLLIILGVLVLSKPKEFEETVRVPEQPTILPKNEVNRFSEPSLLTKCEFSATTRESPAQLNQSVHFMECGVEVHSTVEHKCGKTAQRAEKRLETCRNSANGFDDISVWSSHSSTPED